MDAATLALLTNPEVLRLFSHTSGARQIIRDAHHAVWISRDADGSTYLAFFNLSDAERMADAALDACCLYCAS